MQKIEEAKLFPQSFLLLGKLRLCKKAKPLFLRP